MQEYLFSLSRPSWVWHQLASEGQADLLQELTDFCLPEFVAVLAAAPEHTTGMTALHYAAAGGAAAAVELLLRLAPAVVGAADSFGHWLPLHFAAGSGRLRALRLLLEALPAAAGAAGDSGDLPLHVAVSGGNEEAVQLLLAAHPAAAWTADRQGQLPLHIAAARPSVRIARLLLSAYPAAASMPDKMGRVPVYTAAESATGRPRMVRLLLAATPAAALLGSADAAAGAAAAATPPSCFTPLHEAARRGDYESVRLLLAAAPQAAGAVDGKGRLPLQLALERPGRRRGGVLRLLIAAAPEAAVAAVRKQQLIHWAAKKGSVKALELLLPLAPEQAEQPDDHGWLPIHYVARGSLRNCPAMARMLMAAAPGCAMAAEPERGSLPLHLAASGCLPLVQLLTAAAPQAVTTPDATGQIPLQVFSNQFIGHWRRDWNRKHVEALLAPAPATAALAVDRQGLNPAHWAVVWRAEDLLQLVLRAAPGLAGKPDARGRLPLHVAAMQGEVAAARALLAVLPEAASIPDNHGSAPLPWAAEHGESATMVRLLLEVAPEIAHTGFDGDGDSALACAALGGNPDSVALLVAASPEMALVCNKAGELPLAQAVVRRVGRWVGARYHNQNYPIRAREERLAAGRALLAVTPPDLALPVLAEAGDLGVPLVAELATRYRLTPEQWALVPGHFPGLATALPAVMGRLDVAGAREVVRRLAEGQRERLRCLALCLARACRQLEAPLPAPVAWRMLAIAL